MKIDLIDAIQHMIAVGDLQLTELQPPFEALRRFDYGLRDTLDPHFDWEIMGRAMLEATPDRVLLQVEDSFGMQYFLFRLPDEEDKAYIIGPWRRELPPEQVKEARRWQLARFTPEMIEQLDNFYNAILPLESAETFSNVIQSLLATACPHIDGLEDFHVELRKEFLPMNFRLDERHFSVPTFEQELSMPLIEERYRNENELMEAVAHGDADRAVLLIKQRSRFRYSGDRYFGEVQERRNGLIILNVLLRKSIERAQVHPYYIDQISAVYYGRIRTAPLAEMDVLREEMIVNYCRYVREYSMRQYSPLIRNTINYINLNLSAPLSLRVLAEQFFISPSYLSNLFRNEVGVTLVDYISTCRVKRAARLLTETNLSITAIAEQVGIVDVNYFAKIFKKAYQTTPTHYRRSSREQNARLAPQKTASVE